MACVMALGAAGTTMWALSRPTVELLEPTLLQQRTLPSAHKAPVLAAETTDDSMYWTVAKSYYDASGALNADNGVVRQFGTRVEIEGDNATIYGLVDLYYDEVDKEYGVQGKYDDRAGTITIEGTQYDSDKPVSSFIKLADMYRLSTNEDYTVVLFAGDMWGQQLETIDKLVFKVSDDLSTLTSETGYGAYAFSVSGNPMAFYDYYQPRVTMTQATPESGMTTSVDILDFNGLFIATNMPVKQTIYIYNRSSEETTFTITSSTSELVPSVTEGKIAACSSRAVEVTLTPTQAGKFDGSLTLSSPLLSEPIIITADVEIWEQPDYTKITKAESTPIEFDMSPVYPFVITEYDGHVAAKSTNNGKGDNTQSFFVCKLDVPKGQTGVFSWEAAQITSQPNTLIISLDGEPIKYNYEVDSSQPVAMSGIVALTEGQHEIGFCQEITMDWTKYGSDSEGYVWGLDFQLMESKENLVYLVSDTADFGSTYYDGFSVEMDTEVKLLNLGTSSLKVTEIKSNGNFSGIVPTISVPQGGEIAVPLTWQASAIGEDNSEIIIVTTAGELKVNCKGLGESLPYDYSQFVTEGEIAFNTDVTWPFKLSDNGKYLYNSTSKSDIDGKTDSWIEAIFEIPEGKIGIISWDAINDSENIFYFMDIPSLISGTRFTIDGTNEVMVGGQNVNCSSSDIYSPDQLIFKTGRHNVRFTYKKTSNEDRYIFGDDRLKIFEIGLRLENPEDHKADISTSKINYPSPVYVGCIGHYPINIINYTSDIPELISYSCDGPFVAKTMGIKDGNLNLTIEFTPEKGGEYESEMTISTNVGDFTVNCKGSAEESVIGTAIFYESFEYDFESNWVIKDGNDDGNSWLKISNNITAFKDWDLTPYDGNEGLVLRGFDPDNWEDYFDTDDYATTPEIEIPSNGVTTLRFMVKSWSYMEQNLDILVGEGDDISAYKNVEQFGYYMPTNWSPCQVDLSEFAGKKIRIAFKGYYIVQYLAIDDVLVATTGTTSVNQVNADKEIVSEEFYNLEGKRLAQPVKGVNIVITHYADGTYTSTKYIVK